MTAFRLIKEIPCANVLGEGIQWNHRDQSFWWTDIKSNCLFRYTIETEALQTWDMPENLGCFAFVEDSEDLLLGLASGYAWFNTKTGATSYISQPEAHWTGNRFNDGRVDRQGRFWVGSIMEQRYSEEQSAGLFCLDNRLDTRQHLSGLHISNSLCWSLDGKRLFHADSPTHCIQQYDFDVETGSLGVPSVFAKTPNGIEPDGACIDSQDYLWNAQWGSYEVVRYTPEGAIDTRLRLPVKQPTCIAFGGENLNLLAVTSASIGLNEQSLNEQPSAGNVFIFETDYRGVPESWYRREKE